MYRIWLRLSKNWLSGRVQVAKLGLNHLMEDVMPLWLIIVLAAVPYLALGFFLGIFREWAAQALNSRRNDFDRQMVAATTMFPFSMATRGDRLPDRPQMLDATGGGFAYWIVVAFLWPVIMLMIIYTWLVFGAIEGVKWVLFAPSRLCQSCETAIRRRFRIEK